MHKRIVYGKQCGSETNVSIGKISLCFACFVSLLNVCASHALNGVPREEPVHAFRFREPFESIC